VKVEGLVGWNRLHGGKRSDEVLKGLPKKFSATAGSLSRKAHDDLLVSLDESQRDSRIGSTSHY
jgi:hypothetical protein